MPTNTRRWRSIAALLLVAGLALPAPTAADEREKGEGGDRGGGVCSPRPAGCKKEDCRCEDKKTCKECRQFVCRRGKKQPPVVVCRPCCEKNGKTKCSPAPEEDDKKCVPSPS